MGLKLEVSPLFPQAFAPIVEAHELGTRGILLIRLDRNNFVPRIGIAYRPWDNETVFRAGFGIFFDNAPATMNEGGSPYLLNEPSLHQSRANAPNVILPLVFPARRWYGYSRDTHDLSSEPADPL